MECERLSRQRGIESGHPAIRRVSAGASAFGVAGLVTACVAPALAFSNALALSTTRELAQRLAPDERDDARRFFATALLLASASAGCRSRWHFRWRDRWLAHVFNLNGEAANDLSLRLFSARPDGCASASRRCFLRCLPRARIIARLASISVAEHGGLDHLDVGADPALATGVDVSRLPGSGLCDRAAGGVRAFAPAGAGMAGAPGASSGPLGGLVNLGAWQFAAQGGGLIAGQADRYLLGAFLAPQFVGYYTIAQRLEEADVYRHPQDRRNPVSVF